MCLSLPVCSNGLLHLRFSPCMVPDVIPNMFRYQVEQVCVWCILDFRGSQLQGTVPCQVVHATPQV